MTKAEILAALKHQTNAERLTIAKVALRMAREEWKSLTPEEKEQQLAMAAQLAILDYLQDEELTAFSALDSEEFSESTHKDFAEIDSHA
ncbi:MULTISPECIES: hypothetical protein [Aerosakkonema]|uniref:hypothetical protein n=1 Tax=Aerosakkonema TaxID=1246629 RepID=UPI0035B73189